MENLDYNNESGSNPKRTRIEVDVANLPTDPGLRIKICNYHPNERDQIRRHYLQNKPCQPVDHDFPQSQFGKTKRRFNLVWFKDYPSWLEHSITKDAAYCLFCYLFRPDTGDQGGGDSFVTEGFRNWKKKEKLQNHVGDHNSAHNIAQRKCEALLNQRQSIQTVINKQSDVEKREYRTRLNASMDCICFLLRQGLAFRGHDESKDSNNQGNFLELLRFLANHNEEIDKAVLENAPENHQMTSPDIQKEIANAAAVETINAIIKDIGDSLFAIIVDESRDMSTKEQMAIALRYVDKLGHVNERFLGITHVNNTSAVTLKSAIEEVFNKHSLSISRLRGQGYDGASNMRDNPSAYYVYCFAHQLQLTLVAVAKNHIQIATFFNLVAKVFNIVGASCKRHDILREKRNAEVIEALKNNEISTGRGLNQEMSLKRPGNTRWSSHYGALVNIIHMFSSVIDVIETIIEDGLDSDQRAEANILIGLLQTFEFVFDLHLMKGVLGKSNELSQALQRKDQDIVNAMKLVDISKQRLQEVSAFCAKNNIDVPDMDDFYQPRPRRKAQNMKNSHHYQVELFYTFSALKGIGQLAEKMVEMKKNVSYPLVYSLVTLALILPVATATVERAFSAMNIIKNRLRNRIGDQWMNDCLVTYIEKDIFKTIECEEIMQRFQNMKNRRGQLSKIS
ncbi:hypothetical protein ACB092_07G014500 [Castanea dentata]